MAHNITRSINEHVELGVKYSSAELTSCLKAAGVKYPDIFCRELCKVCSYVSVSNRGKRNVIVRTGAITEEVVERVRRNIKLSIRHYAIDDEKAISYLKSRGYIIYKLV